MPSSDGFSEKGGKTILNCLNKLGYEKLLDIHYPAPPYTPCEERSTVDDLDISLDHNNAEALKRNPWSLEEAEKLGEIKNSHPDYSCHEIALKLNELFHTNRDAKQVEQRWCRVEDPQIEKGCWTSEEDALLYLLSEKYNGSVRKIRKQLFTRTVVEIRARMDYLGIERLKKAESPRK